MQEPQPEVMPRDPSVIEETKENESESQPRHFDQEDDEEEDECRVCRGPAEDGRPLYKPCRCSGSMGMVHQDCLTSWLQVTRKDGRCEICKTKFRFDPQYAENAPERLPAHEVVVGLSSRFLAKWLPLAIRLLIAASLWLIVAPFLTNCIYHGWIIRPSSVLTRWKRDLILSDVVSGVVMSAIIIISFLSLMSFADFLRGHWQQQQGPRAEQQRRNQEQPQQGRNDRFAEPFGNQEKERNVVEEDDVDHRLHDYLRKRLQSPSSNTVSEEDSSGLLSLDDHDKPVSTPPRTLAPHELSNQAKRLRELGMEREARIQVRGGTEGWDGRAEIGIEDQDLVVVDPDENDNVLNPPLPAVDEIDDGWNEEDGLDDEAEALREENDAVPPEPIQRVVNDQANIDPVLQDDQVDIELNVALDELLGLRGPLATLVRNLLWLLAFNATYLGIFGFIPKTVGSVVYSGLFNTTFCSNMMQAIPYVYSENENQTSLYGMLTKLEEESLERNTTFKLSDFATVTLGYLSIAAMVVMARFATVVFEKVGQKIEHNYPILFRNRQEGPHNRRGNLGEQANAAMEGQEVLNDNGPGTSLTAALDTIVAIVKVGVLLFLKMFMLPLCLGFWLDFSTVSFFGHDAAQRLAFAGSDLFSFILLHWVAGITFMLLVTVFLLQLREVTHPDVLARMIRPQEPQPDLLGNLMNETVLTHMKRMLLSLAIYAPLLTMHITLPIKLFMASGFADSVPLFHLHFYHFIMPQLQIPLELIIFHLSMLALLERYKNSIGGLQHGWMKFMCRRMGLTEYLLPQEVIGFEYIGKVPVFRRFNDEACLLVDPFFVVLTHHKKDVDEFIQSKINQFDTSSSLAQPLCFPFILKGEEKDSGEKVLSLKPSYISLPAEAGGCEDDDAVSEFLPTRIGQYRLRLIDCDTESPDSESSSAPFVEFFREIQGEEISRPPEGWDDLGQGGAAAQGRWSWASEKKSKIEEGTACRTPFRSSSKLRRPIVLTLKVVVLMILSWFAITLTGLIMFSMPLAVGRSFYHLLRIPSEFIHDPLAFCIGAGLFFPFISLLSRAKGNQVHKVKAWLLKFRMPPTRKLLVLTQSFFLWIIVAPIALGLSYELVVVKSEEWFVGKEPFMERKVLAFAWVMGTVFLNTWAFLLYHNFFTKRFWATIGNGILEPPIDENGNANPLARNPERLAADGIADDNLRQLTWQGNQGSVAKFYGTWTNVLSGWEWEDVDRTILVDEFARPVAKQLSSALVGSFMSYQLFICLIMLPYMGHVGNYVSRAVLFRVFMTLHILMQLAAVLRVHVGIWFEAAHEAARDDRYLVGELLMNFEAHEGGN